MLESTPHLHVWLYYHMWATAIYYGQDDSDFLISGMNAQVLRRCI